MKEIDRARTYLTEKYPGATIEILQLFDIAWSGWECESTGALITRDGVPELVIVDQVGGHQRPVPEIVRDRLQEYRRLTIETEAALDRYRKMGGQQ